ncbi:uncharacterized protein LOC133326784 [Musca vetustissima]|uniref:uncharacterized protein LOC133326784 n=1 Tax=Musca vetustissima TaxID=27455 RepID=UPI002AB7B12D|nr:uncharacterized protein LOC133326784 [Musca vetustissima]
MAPQEKVEFVILRLTFLPYVHPQYPRITLTHKRHSPSSSMTQVRDWFDRIMSREKSKVDPQLSIRYCEWNVTSGNASLFTVNGYRFDKILLVLGEDVVHWIFYQNMPLHRRIEGCGRLSVNYCGCCLNTQYLKIMETVKGCVMQRGTYY